MKILYTVLFLFVFVSITAQKVKTDVNPDVDFSQYGTYEFLGWQDNSDQILNDLDKRRMRDAFKTELSSRNLEPASGADMAISLYIVVTQETSTTAYTNYYGAGGYGYRYGGRGWGNGYSTTSYSENDYLKGTLVMDVFDGESKELIWQGVATGTVQENPKKRDKSIPKSVSKLMKKFPIKPVK